MCLVKYLTMTFSFGSPVEINNSLPTSKACFPQFRVIERFVEMR